MAEPDTERVRELTEAFEIVLSYVGRVYRVEYERPIGYIAMGLVGCLTVESIGMEANRLPGQDAPEDSIYKCGVCLCEVSGVEYTYWDKMGRLHVVCRRCLDALERMFGRNGKADLFLFK